MGDPPAITGNVVIFKFSFFSSYVFYDTKQSDDIGDHILKLFKATRLIIVSLTAVGPTMNKL